MIDESAVSLALLASRARNDRARAIAWLVQNPHQIDTRELMRALQVEVVPQLRRGLLDVLEARKSAPQPPGENSGSGAESDDCDSVGRQSDSVDVGALIRHELSPVVGWIRVAAEDEIRDYATSKTQEAVRKLQRRIDGLVALVKSTSAPTVRRVEVAKLLRESWPVSDVSLEFAPAPEAENLEIETDEDLFILLVSNVFQNAIDATVDMQGGGVVSATWGRAGERFWIRVSNTFNGDRLSLAEVVDRGNSSKVAHAGQGLSLIRRVAEILGFVVDLDGRSGVASFTVSGRLPSG